MKSFTSTAIDFVGFESCTYRKIKIQFGMKLLNLKSSVALNLMVRTEIGFY